MLGWWLPENVSTYGNDLFHLLYWSSGIGVLIVQAILFRVRRSPSGGALREVVWAIVPALLLVWLGLASHRTANALAQSRPQLALETQILPPAHDGDRR